MAKRINLLPQAERTRTATNFGTLGILAAAIIVVFAIALGYYLLHTSLAEKEKELAAVELDTAALVREAEALSQYESLQARRAAAETVVQAVYARRTLVSDVLDALSLVIPDTAWLQSLSLATITPSGPSTGGASSGDAPSRPQTDNRLAVEGNTYSFEDVAQLLVRLQLVPSLSGVYLVSAGDARGPADPAKVVRGFSIEAFVVNTQAEDVALPMSQVEVEGL